MKFTDGYWQIRPGVTPHYAAQPINAFANAQTQLIMDKSAFRSFNQSHTAPAAAGDSSRTGLKFDFPITRFFHAHAQLAAVPGEQAALGAVPDDVQGPRTGDVVANGERSSFECLGKSVE